MKLVLSWLNDLAPLGDDVDDLAATHDPARACRSRRSSVAGSTVDGVITARVLRTERHPDAAKVHRVWVDAGDGIERHVWCGAFNMAAGDVVPLATPGTAMPDGTSIEPKPILGIESQGMLCSARELGLGDDHAGILILPARHAARRAVRRGARPRDRDRVRRRPHPQPARLLGPPRRGPRRRSPPRCADGSLLRRRCSPTARSRSASVELVDGDRCPRFTTLVLSGIRVGPSPDWMVRRLQAAGMRSINNVVDVSNYVMLELNQPNHAYDLDTLGGGGFRIRLAREGEVMTTLDGVERTLIVRRSADLRCQRHPDRHRRRHGRARLGDHRRHHRRGARDRVVRADRDHANDEPSRPPVRGVRSFRARGRSVRHRRERKPASSSCCARRARTSSSTTVPSMLATHHSLRPTGRPAFESARSTGSSGRHSMPTTSIG